MITEASPLAPSSFSFPPNHDLGDLSILPPEVVVYMLSKLHNPLSVAPVNQTMRALALDAVKEQLANDGIYVRTFSEKLARDVHPVCLQILRQFGLDLAALSRKAPALINAEFRLLLDSKLELLSDAPALHAFLKRRLFENSREIARLFFDARLFGEPVSAQLSFDRSFSSRSHYAAQGALPLVPHEASAHSVHALLSALKEAPVDRSSMPLIRVRGEAESPTARFSPSVPLRVLSLPPAGMLDRLAANLSAIRVTSATLIPSAIGQLKTIKILCLDQCLMSELPDELANGAFQQLWIEGCPNLRRLPQSLMTMPSLQKLFIINCPQLPSDDPVLAALKERGTAASSE